MSATDTTTDAPAPTLQGGRSFPVVGTILGAWVVLYLLMMWHGGWQWAGVNAFAVGTPQDFSLRMFGAVMPSQLRWQSPWLAPFLHDSLIGLIFLFFFWRSTGGTLAGVVGKAWTWVLFVAGSWAATATHLHYHPDSGLIHAIGPIDPILCGVGFFLGWGLTHRDQRGLLWRGIKTLLFLALWMVALTWIFGGSFGAVKQLLTERVREYAGLEAMLGALCGGVGCAFVLGTVRALAADAFRTLGVVLAFGLLGVTLAAAGTQAIPLLQGERRSEAVDFLEQLRRVERSVSKLTDQRRATNVQRDELARHHSKLMAHRFLEGMEGREALEAYAEVLGRYRKPIDDPFLIEPQLKKRYKAWYEGHEKALRDELAISARPFDPWKRL